jgi:hypothetical protein
MTDAVSPRSRSTTGKRILIVLFGALSAFMYVSIMVKIIKYGP